MDRESALLIAFARFMHSKAKRDWALTQHVSMLHSTGNFLLQQQ